LLSKPSVFIRLYFNNTADLQAVRREVLPLALANSAKLSAVDAYAEVVSAEAAVNVMFEEEDGAQEAWGAETKAKSKASDREPAECIVDIREHDINYYQRVAIDLGEFYLGDGSVAMVDGHSMLSRRSCWSLVHDPVGIRSDYTGSVTIQGQAS
jgi:DNA polymerase elongation subunit (family B)